MGLVAIGTRVLNLVSMIILARLLEPADFGFFALAMLVFSTAGMVAGFNLDSAVIQSKLDKGRIAFPAFLVTGLASFLLFLVILIGAPLWADLLGNADVAPVIRGLSATMVLEGLALVPMALLRKDLRFGIVGKARLISQVIHTATNLILAFLGFGVWSLVYGALAGALSRVVIVWFASPGWIWLVPRRWQAEDLKGLLRYGTQATGAGAVYFINHNGDDFLVGRLLGATALGYYSKAYRFATKFIEGLNEFVISAVFFPAYAKIQDEKERLAAVYVKTLQVVALVMVPMALGVLAVAAEAVPVAVGDKWIPMIPCLQVYTLHALVRPFASTTSPVFMSVGRPDYNIRAGLVVTATMIPLALLMLDWGITGVAAAVTIAFAVGFAYNLLLMHRILPGIVPKMLRAIAPALAAGCLMVLGVLISKAPLLHAVGGKPNAIMVGAMLAVGAAIYVLIAYLLQREFVVEVVRLFLSAVRSRRGRPTAAGQ